MEKGTELDACASQMRERRHDIHLHPELGFDEHCTAALVADLLRGWDIDVKIGISGTNVVDTIHGRFGEGRSLGSRADMDALLMREKGTVPYRSTQDDVFHGCGHDGHTAVLLSVAKRQSAQREFRGTVSLIFQPAEETLRGGSAMIGDGLFERFPCDEIYPLHNSNALPKGSVGVRVSAILSACNLFHIHITGVGGHAAAPHKTIDPIMVATHVARSIQSIVSRNVSSIETAVVSVCKFIAGAAINVIADTAALEGAVGTRSAEAQSLVLTRLRAICDGTASIHGCEIVFEHSQSSPPPVNTNKEIDVVRRAAKQVVGVANVFVGCAPPVASEDFACMLQQRPGSYFFLGHDGLTCYRPEFDFDDDTAPTGAAVFAKIVKQRLN